LVEEQDRRELPGWAWESLGGLGSELAEERVDFACVQYLIVEEQQELHEQESYQDHWESHQGDAELHEEPLWGSRSCPRCWVGSAGFVED
ncbi:hypothetical protein KCV03_g347, partial [Aureobasidium melanogenum]